MAAEKILIIKLGALGDFIQAFGPIAAIRQHHSGAHVTLLTTAPYKDLAAQSGYFNSIIIDEKPKWHNVTGWMKLGKKLAAENFSRVYDLQNNDRTSFYLRLFPAHKRPEWVGAAPRASHRNTSPERTAGHAFDGHVQTLALAGIKNITIDPLNWLKADISAFAIQSPYVLLVPGSAANRTEKRWPIPYYLALAQSLEKRGFQIVVLGSSAEKDLALFLADGVSSLIDLSGRTTFGHIATLARHAAYAIGNDTGPMHLIAATGCRSLVLFSGASNPLRHAPKGEKVAILQEKSLKDLKPETVLESLK